MLVFTLMIWIQMVLSIILGLDAKADEENRDSFSKFHAARIILFFQVLTFYFVLFSMIFFLMLTRVLPFTTLRERQGYSLNLKNK